MIRLQDKWVIANADGTRFAGVATSIEGGVLMVEHWGGVSFFLNEAFAELFIEHYFEPSQGMQARRTSDFPEKLLAFFAGKLLEAAEELGHVVTIALHSPAPLSMRNHFPVVDVWPKQGV